MKAIIKKDLLPILTGLMLIGLCSDVSAQRGTVHGGVPSSGGARTGSVPRGGYHGSTGFHGGFHGNYGFRGGFYRGYVGYPHVGFFIPVLPFGYSSFYWGPDEYYYYGGIFYLPNNRGFVVTVPPLGAAVPNLPDGAQAILIDGEQYYELNGVYYKQGTNDKGKKIYVVAGKDGILNTGDAKENNNVRTLKVGDVVSQLPDGCRKIYLNEKTYFVSPDDVYYTPFTSADNKKAYRVVSIPATEPDGE